MINSNLFSDVNLILMKKGFYPKFSRFIRISRCEELKQDFHMLVIFRVPKYEALSEREDTWFHLVIHPSENSDVLRLNCRFRFRPFCMHIRLRTWPTTVG